MKKFVFVVTNNESHWRDIIEQLKEKEVSFYPETIEDFNNLRNLCHVAFCHKEECVIEAEVKIGEIINKFSNLFFCLIRFQITEGDVLENGILFFKFYEKFLINNPKVKLIIYLQHGGGCSCGDCIKKAKKQEEKAIAYCKKKEFPYFCWIDGRKFFVKDKYEMTKLPREKLSSVDILSKH